MSSKLLFALLVLAVGVASFVVAKRTIGGADELTAAPGPPPSPEAVATARATLEAKLQDDKSKPRYIGRLGDFALVGSEEEFRANAPCPVTTTRTIDTGFAVSELNMRNMLEQGICADGTVVNVHAVDGSRFYFAGMPKVDARAPVDRLELIQISGRPALIVKPIGGLGPHTLYVIQRPASPERLGIFLLVMSRDGLDSALNRASSLLGN